ncbi:hypothetical protein Ddc_11932 [Ditylenchus destructor]|nr:hypothetical protein Ddc_11932 [Ditylenchus destructor]
MALQSGPITRWWWRIVVQGRRWINSCKDGCRCNISHKRAKTDVNRAAVVLWGNVRSVCTQRPVGRPRHSFGCYFQRIYDGCREKEKGNRRVQLSAYYWTAASRFQQLWRRGEATSAADQATIQKQLLVVLLLLNPFSF